MTFGAELKRCREENPLFANHYINYQALKDAVKAVDVATVMNLLRTELDKINDIVEVEWEAVSSELKARTRKHWNNKDASEIDKESLDNLSEAVVRLHAFIDTNYRAFQNVMKKCTEQPQTASCSWYSSRVDAASFRHHPFDELLVPLGRLYSGYRGARGAGQQPKIQELESKALPSSGEGSAQVFFVPSPLVMRAKVALLKLLEPSAQMLKAKTTQGTRDSSRYTAEFSHRLTQVYFESAKGEQYAERMRRRILGFPAGSRPKGVLVQCRMGPPEDGEEGVPGDPADPRREVTLEVHNEQYQTIATALPQKGMLALLSGKASGSSEAEVTAAEAITEQNLRPAVSALSLRSAFMSAPSQGHAGVELVTIDENVAFRDEASHSDSKAWCVGASRASADARARGQVEFVCAILKVWLPPDGTTSLLGLLDMATEEMKSVPGFSEALHATAFLHRELANPLPTWIPSESIGDVQHKSSLLRAMSEDVATKNKTPKSAVLSDVDKRKKEDDAKKASSGDLSKYGRCFGQGAKPDAKLQVDCKTPMAIERTLLRWMRSTVLLGSLSVLLMSSGGFAGQVNGILLGFVCLLFAFMPLSSYLDRSRQLESPNSKQPKVDRTMPVILVSSFCAVLLSTVVVSTLGYE